LDCSDELMGQLSVEEKARVKERIHEKIGHFKDFDVRNLGTLDFPGNR